MSLLRRYAKPVGVGLVLAGLMFGVYLFAVTGPSMQSAGFDAYAYWAVSMPDAYANPVGVLGSYNYSPAFAQALDWVSAYPFWVFFWFWTWLLVGSIIWLAGSPTWVLVAFSVPFVSLELYHGNIHILLAVAIVLGFRHPWTWSFVLLTKPSAGVGLLWFAVRREWRELGIALGATAVVVAVSFIAAPQTWLDWIGQMTSAMGTEPHSNHIPVSLWIRLPLAVVLVVWGALTDRRWTVVVSSMLALPVLWFAAPAMLVGVLPDLRQLLRARRAAEGPAVEATEGPDVPTSPVSSPR